MPRGQLLRAAVGIRHSSSALLRSRPPRAPHFARFLVRDRTRQRRDGATGLRSPTHPVRREGLARDLLHDWDGALAHERDGHRMGAHAVARDAAGGVGGADHTRSYVMIIPLST